MVSEEAPAAEEAPTKPLFTKIGYDNEVRRQQNSSQYVVGWANSSIMPRKRPMDTIYNFIAIFSGRHLHSKERSRQAARPHWLEEVESGGLVWKH